MKRFVFSAFAIAVMMLMTGCQRESEKGTPDGEFVTASITVSLPGGMTTKAVGDGSGATELLFRAYDSAGKHQEGLDQKVSVSGKQAKVTTRFLSGVGYKLVFWAQSPGRYAITEDTEGAPVVSIASAALPGMMNDDTYDAFYSLSEVDPQSQDFSLDVTLSRPFAQLNLGVGAADYAAAAAGYDLESLFQTGFSIDGVPGTLNLFTGQVSDETDIVYNFADAPSGDIVSGEETYRRIAMVYVLAPTEAGTHDSALSVKVQKKGSNDVWQNSVEVPNVPLKRNCRTNILGNLFAADITLSVSMEAGFVTPDSSVELSTDEESGLRAVDLGLPSGIKWGSCNVGAQKPEDFGDYYAWGETETKSIFQWDNYQFSTQTHGVFSKYNTKSFYGEVDNKTLLETGPDGDDVASKTFGDSWRMPTSEEWSELIAECTSEKTTRNGVDGCLFTAANGNSIFLPSAGFWFSDMFFNDDPAGFYWSSSLLKETPSIAMGFLFNAKGKAMSYSDQRYFGFSVRPVFGPTTAYSALVDEADIVVDSGEGNIPNYVDITADVLFGENSGFTIKGATLPDGSANSVRLSGGTLTYLLTTPTKGGVKTTDIAGEKDRRQNDTTVQDETITVTIMDESNNTFIVRVPVLVIDDVPALSAGDDCFVQSGGATDPFNLKFAYGADVPATSTLTVNGLAGTLSNDGKITFALDAGTLVLTAASTPGAYYCVYTAKNNAELSFDDNGKAEEMLTFAITDADGDTASDTVKVTILFFEEPSTSWRVMVDEANLVREEEVDNFLEFTQFTADELFGTGSGYTIVDAKLPDNSVNAVEFDDGRVRYTLLARTESDIITENLTSEEERRTKDITENADSIEVTVEDGSLNQFVLSIPVDVIDDTPSISAGKDFAIRAGGFLTEQPLVFNYGADIPEKSTLKVNDISGTVENNGAIVSFRLDAGELLVVKTAEGKYYYSFYALPASSISDLFGTDGIYSLPLVFSILDADGDKATATVDVYITK